MTAIDLTLPLSRLVLHDEGGARLAEPGALSHEALGALLAFMVRSTAGSVAGCAVEPVSLTLDTTGVFEDGAAVDFMTDIDRRTRTLVFANGRALQDGRAVMTLTGVFRIPG